MQSACRHSARGEKRGFTLLEMCIVLFIIALLAGAAMPALESAFNERSLRDDAHTFSILAKSAMLRSSEEQRPYMMRLQGKELRLAPVAGGTDMSEGSGASTVAETNSEPQSGEIESLTNPLKLADDKRNHAWKSQPVETWTFQPNSLCPLPRVRFERGTGYLEMSFNALTGDVEDEAYDLP